MLIPPHPPNQRLPSIEQLLACPGDPAQQFTLPFLPQQTSSNNSDHILCLRRFPYPDVAPRTELAPVITLPVPTHLDDSLHTATPRLAAIDNESSSHAMALTIRIPEKIPPMGIRHCSSTDNSSSPSTRPTLGSKLDTSSSHRRVRQTSRRRATDKSIVSAATLLSKAYAKKEKTVQENRARRRQKLEMLSMERLLKNEGWQRPIRGVYIRNEDGCIIERRVHDPRAGHYVDGLKQNNKASSGLNGKKTDIWHAICNSHMSMRVFIRALRRVINYLVDLLALLGEFTHEKARSLENIFVCQELIEEACFFWNTYDSWVNKQQYWPDAMGKPDDEKPDLELRDIAIQIWGKELKAMEELIEDASEEWAMEDPNADIKSFIRESQKKGHEKVVKGWEAEQARPKYRAKL